MENSTAIETLQKANELKEKVSTDCDWLNSVDAWTDRKKLQNLYHHALILDLEYSLDKKVEQDLWNFGFKTLISSLQGLARDKKNPNRGDYQALLTCVLESASGFYITLLQELCNSFGLDLPFRKLGKINQIPIQKSDLDDLRQKSSCFYICQYCLVHLGDIARYRNQRKQAESFYKQAIIISPSSGQPYNQLAILEANRGNKLSTVFYYIRGISVKNPFPASATNLSSTLNAAIDKDSSLEKIATKMTVDEFIELFLCTHGFIHTNSELKKAEQAVRSLNSVMTPLVATQSFTRDMLIEMTAINLYTLKHIGNKLEELTKDEKTTRDLILELIVGNLCAFLVPVHTLKFDESLLDYYALPAVKFLFYLLQNESNLLKEKVFASKLQMWPSLVKLLNNVQKYLKGINFDTYDKYPLSEDKTLQGFLPLYKNFQNFNFKLEIKDNKFERLVRMKRLVDVSLWLTDIDINGNKFIIKNKVGNDVVFEPGSVQPDPTNDLLLEMKSLNLENSENNLKKGSEKKTGILKPQGSLEKSREERELLSSNSTLSADLGTSNVINKNDVQKTKRGKQNVALQSIFKKIEETSKQVKFIDEPTEKEKSVKFEIMSTQQPLTAPQQKQQPPTQPNPQNQQFTLPLRTQSFNQNHPAFPIAPPPPPPPPPPLLQTSDYLSNLCNLSTDKDSPYPYQKTDPVLQRAPNLMLPPYQSINRNITQKPPNGFQQTQASFGNNQIQHHQSTSYHNISFPSDHYNTWKHDELPPMPNPTWWQNNQPSQPNKNYLPDRFPMSYPQYPNFNAPSVIPKEHEYNKPNTSIQSGREDVFNSQWGNYSGNYINNESVRFDGANQGLSVRQAMLKEGMPVGPPGATIRRLPNPSPQEPNFSLNTTTAPGYSLFNTNSWSPNLAGQLCNTKQTETSSNHMQYQSLFSGHGPTSLAQLLEQQNQINNKNNL